MMMMMMIGNDDEKDGRLIYNWKFLLAFSFRYFRASYDSVYIIFFK